MRALRRCLAALGIVIAAVAVAMPAVSSASPGTSSAADRNIEIFADYADGRLDGTYSPTELKNALHAAEGDVGYAGFVAAVDRAYDEGILGLSGGGGESSSSSQQILDLPEPLGPNAGDRPPWPFIALSALAVLLVVTGAGSSVYRRVRRGPSGA